MNYFRCIRIFLILHVLFQEIDMFFNLLKFSLLSEDCKLLKQNLFVFNYFNDYIKVKFIKLNNPFIIF